MTAPAAVQFTETMRGFIAPGARDFDEGFRNGRQAGAGLMFRLTIRAVDVERFVAERDHSATATGYVECAALGGRLPVERGTFNLFVETSDRNARRMLYRLLLRDPAGRLLTLSGFKHVQDQAGPDVWIDTTTLYVNVFQGEVAAEDEAAARVLACGIIRIAPADFARQLTTIGAEGPTFQSRMEGVQRFGSFFFGSLWQLYGPSRMPAPGAFQREIPLYTTEGVSGAEVTTHPFVTQDRLGLSLLRFHRAPCEDVVVIIHGLTTSSDMFIMPEHENLVQYLLDHGYSDVFTLDFRMSNRFQYNLHRHRYSMDDIALYDYPPALATVRDLVGDGRRVHVICHCLGSVSFMMSLFGKAVDGITSVISNSVALSPRIPGWSRVKLTLGPFLVENFTSIEYLNPYWRREPGWGLGKCLAWWISLFHRECDVPECHMLSFMWGSGFPAVYRHENLLDVTHRRGGDLYGGVSLHYYRHVRKMVASGNAAVKFDPRDPRFAALPQNYLDLARDITTPVLFITGQQNRIFLDSNILCHQRLERLVPGRHELHVFPNYGHQDVFMGKNCAVDVFPRLLQFLDKHAHRPARTGGTAAGVTSPVPSPPFSPAMTSAAGQNSGFLSNVS